MDCSEHRRSDRSPVAMSARCRTDKGGRAYVAMLNLSEEGCCVLMRDPVLYEGQRVQLWPEGLGNLIARVQWTNGNLAGLRFDRPLYGPVYDHLTKIYSRSAELEGSSESSTKGDTLPDPLREELLESVRRREAADTKERSEVDDLYRTINITGTRPGLQPRRSDEKLVQLFLS
jgi:hypothetical protein